MGEATTMVARGDARRIGAIREEGDGTIICTLNQNQKGNH